jgi:hypothetical protein
VIGLTLERESRQHGQLSGSKVAGGGGDTGANRLVLLDVSPTGPPESEQVVEVRK